MRVFEPGSVVSIEGQSDVNFFVESVHISRVGLSYKLGHWVNGEKKTQYVAPQEISAGDDKITIGFKA
jgi:hypothetical protein